MDALCGLVLLGVSAEDAGKLPGRSVDNLCNPGSRGLDHANQFRTQLIERRHGCQRLDPIRVQVGRAKSTTKDRKLFVCLGEIDGCFRSGYRIVGMDDNGRALKQVGDVLKVGALKGEFDKAVFATFTVPPASRTDARSAVI